MDKRIKKSKAAIKKALADLVIEQGFDKLTISDIAKRADINRKTFYNCYPDVYAVIDEIEDDTVAQFVLLLSDIDFTKGVPDPMLLYGKISYIMNKDLPLFDALVNKNNEKLTKKLVVSVSNRTQKRLCELYDVDADTAHIISAFLINGLFSVFGMWISEGKKQPIDEVAWLVGKLASDALSTVARKQVS